MGGRQSKRGRRHRLPPRPRAYLQFEDFEILRAIGRGTFGKVCLVERKENKKMLAMKYVNKEICLKQRAVDNVLDEVELLRVLDHPFIVSLWFTFQDAEDLFIILEPLMGGDLRFHLNNEARGRFSEESVRFICAEMALALDYLRSKNIIHRDVKPDNILLDDQGHAHLTDFNVATAYDGQLPALRTLAGTKPYMALEVFKAASSSASPGYDFAVDWWSLGVTAYELKTGQRPYDIGMGTSLTSAIHLLESSSWEELKNLQDWSPEFAKFFQSLIQMLPEKRVTSWAALKKTKLMANLKYNRLISRQLPPPFVPSAETLNCDPTFELEEMIVEAKPLHKKKKRLLRQQSILSNIPLNTAGSCHSSENNLSATVTAKFNSFPNYSREWERYQASLQEKEMAWELELMKLMEGSTLTATATLTTGGQASTSSATANTKTE